MKQYIKKDQIYVDLITRKTFDRNMSYIYLYVLNKNPDQIHSCLNRNGEICQHTKSRNTNKMQIHTGNIFYMLYKISYCYKMLRKKRNNSDIDSFFNTNSQQG